MKRNLICATVFTFSVTGFLAPAGMAQSEADLYEQAQRAELEAEAADLQSGFGLNAESSDSNLVDRDDHHQGGHRNPCRELRLDDAQKKALKEALFAFKKEQITLTADKKLAKLAYAQTVLTDSSQLADAETAGTSLVAAGTKIEASKVGLANKILYDILTAEQRKPGFKCLLYLKAHRRGHHGHQHHRPGHHGGHHGGHHQGRPGA